MYQESDKLFPQKKLSVCLPTDQLRFWRKLKTDLPMDNSRLLLRFPLFFSLLENELQHPNCDSVNLMRPMELIYHFSI